jgi:hypothetical protein
MTRDDAATGRRSGELRSTDRGAAVGSEPSGHDRRSGEVRSLATPTVSGGPPLVLLAIATTALFLASVPLGFLLAGEVPPSPFASSGRVVEYYSEAGAAVNMMALLQFGSAMPFIAFAATTWTRMRSLGVQAAGPGIAFGGAIVSGSCLVVSALTRWTLADPPAEPGVVNALHDLSFIFGGPGTVVPFALLLAGIAIPAGFGRLLSRLVVVTGLVLAGIAVLSSLTLVVEGASYVLLPVARFGGLAWLIVVGAQLPKPRPELAWE